MKWHEISEKYPNPGVYGWEHLEGVSLKLKQTVSYISKKVEEDQLVSKNKLSEIFNLDTIMTFGKYKGLSIAKILTTDSNYLMWGVKNINKFSLSEEVISILNSKI